MADPVDLTAAVNSVTPEDLAEIGEIIENDDGTATALPPDFEKMAEPPEDF